MEYIHNSFKDNPIFIDPQLVNSKINAKDDFNAEIVLAEEITTPSFKLIIINWFFKMINADTGKDAVRYVAEDLFRIDMPDMTVDIAKLGTLIDDSASNFIKGWSTRKRNTPVMKKIITPPSIQKKESLITQIHNILIYPH